MEFRHFFKNIFKNKDKSNLNGFSILKALNSYIPFLLSDNDNVYDNMYIRSCIHTIAKHTAKLLPKIKGYKTKYIKRLEYLLTYSPNKLDNRYNFFYKLVSQLLTNNNAFVFINYDNNNLIEGFYPIPYSSIQFLEKDNIIYCKFLFKSGYKVILPYDELIHLKRHYNDNDLFGSSQSGVLDPILKLFRSFIEGFINSIKATSMLRGYLKYGGNLKEETLQNYKKQFVSSYMDMQNGDGIGALDSKCDFISTKIEPYTIDSKNQDIANKSIYIYYGISEPILTGNFNEEEFNSFYSNTIEPIGIQISEEFTRKVFNQSEIENGKSIIMSASRLTFANNSTKMNICKDGLSLGLFTFNECREIFDFESIEGGDKRIISLNYVDADKANEYQGISKNIGSKNDEQKTNQAN